MGRGNAGGGSFTGGRSSSSHSSSSRDFSGRSMGDSASGRGGRGTFAGRGISRGSSEAAGSSTGWGSSGGTRTGGSTSWGGSGRNRNSTYRQGANDFLGNLGFPFWSGGDGMYYDEAPPPIHKEVFYQEPYYQGPEDGPYYTGGQDGTYGGHHGMKTKTKLSTILTVFGAVLVFYIILIQFGKNMDDKHITASTTNRSPLGSEACTESKEWYDDQLDWIASDAKLLQGLKTFYKETGVQPYIIITDQVNGKGQTLTDSEAEAYLQKRYDELFQDEGHLLFLFLEYEGGKYKEFLYLGNKASSVIDREAQEIIYDYADYYYTSDLSDDVFFAKVFDKSSKRIMSRTSTPTDLLKAVLAFFMFLGGGIAVSKLITKRKKLKLKEAEERRKILETPIEKIVESELKDKYKD